MAAPLKLENVSARYGDRVALDDVTASFEAGRITGLVGPNGAGKTSLLRGCIGLLPLTCGFVTVLEFPRAHWSREALARAIAYLPQGGEAHWPVESRRLVALGRMPHRAPFAAPSRFDSAAIDDALARCDATLFAARRVDRLSAGERARVLLARALATGAPVLLADEPAAHLDPAHQLRLMELLREEANRGTAVVVTLHDLTAASRFCDMLLVMKSGRIIARGAPGAALSDANLADAFGVTPLRPAAGETFPHYSLVEDPMSKKHDDGDVPAKDRDYHRALYDLQVELVKLQRNLIAEGARVLVILEGRDGAGKDGAIKRLTEHMSPRETRIHAPGKPSSREETEWYFQRFVPFLPAGEEFVVFNRSWYNRAGVERVMGFCKPRDVDEFFESVVPFESMLVRNGIAIRKYYLDISRHEQKKRLAAREDDPLKQWKTSPVDQVALKNWKKYTDARDEMFRRTSHVFAPWRILHADTKQVARLELIRDLLVSFSYEGKSKKLAHPDAATVFPWSEDAMDKVAK